MAQKVIKVCKNNALEGGCIPKYEQWVAQDGCEGFSFSRVNNNNLAMVFIDGTILIRYYWKMPLFLVDVNGFDGPNKIGHDLFSFYLFTDEYAGNTYLSPGYCFVKATKATNGKSTQQMLDEVLNR